MFKLIVLFFVLSGTTIVQAQPHQDNKKPIRLINSGAPLTVHLTLNKEAYFEFDFNLSQVGILPSIREQVSIQSVDSRLWIKALTAFGPTRFLIKDQHQKIRAILLIRADSTADKHSHFQVISKKVVLSQGSTTMTEYLSYVDMVRFLAQSLYAPNRLIKDIGMSRVFVDNRAIDLFVCSKNLACNGNVLAKPILSYRSGDYYATAIILKNQTEHLLHLDPRDLIGNYLAAAFQFNKLGKKGSSSDVSVAYLISNKPIAQILRH